MSMKHSHCFFCADNQEENGQNQSRRKRRSRWGGSEHDKIFIPGMPTILPSNLNKEQEQAYLCKYFCCFLSLLLCVVSNFCVFVRFVSNQKKRLFKQVFLKTIFLSQCCKYLPK